MKKNETPIRRIVVVRLYGLGNFLFTLPLLDALPQAYSRAKVTLLLDRRCRQIAELARPDLRRVIIENDFDAEKWFAREKPDLVLFTYPCADADLLRAATRHARTTVAHNAGRNENLATISLTADERRHEAWLNLDLLAAVGKKPRRRLPRLTVPRTGHDEARRLLRENGVTGPFVALHPGCFPDLAVKRWPPRYYGELADKLHADGYAVVLIGGPDELDLAAPIQQAAAAPVVDLIAKTSLAGVAAVLRKAVAVVANDTGLMHLGAAVGTPVIGIYGPTSWEKNTPLIARHFIVRRDVSCSPCYRPGVPLGNKRAWCLEMTTPDLVHDTLTALLAKRDWRLPERPQPFVSIIVPTFNGEKKLARLLPSLLNQSYPRDCYEIIVVDNNSTDGTAAFVRSFDGVRYEFYDRVQTSYAARNHGIGVARGEILAFTDDDCEADPHWLSNAVQWFAHPDVGGVAGRILGGETDNDIARWQSRRKYLDLHPDLETSLRPNVVTANVCYRRDVFARVGLFSESMISSGDLEFSYRLTADGRYRFRAASDATVRHFHREDLRSLFKVSMRYGYGHVDLDRRFPLDERTPRERLRESGRAWRKLLGQGVGFLQTGLKPGLLSGLRDERPEEFFVRVSDPSKACLVTTPALRKNPVVAQVKRFGIAVIETPVPPMLEYLDRAMELIAERKPAGLYLYAAGQHTRRLQTRAGFAAMGAQGVIDDRAQPGQEIGGLPVVTQDEALRRGCRTILISTDAFEHELLPKLRPLAARGVAVLGLYDEEAMARLGRHLDLHAPEELRAIFIPNGELAGASVAALARGAGIFQRLDAATNSRYSDEFLEWMITVAKRLGRIAGTIRFRHWYV
ncbi:MAG TPA: glycosyltransferase family 9 protein [bacterium]|nr:glycosyltransferase family 9 protein [bacterium]